MSEKVSFAYMDMLKEAFELLKANLGIFIGVSALHFVIAFAASMTYVGQHIIMGPLLFGLNYLALKAVRGNAIAFNDYFLGFKVFLPTLLTYIVVAFFSAIGIIFCIIPGIIIAVLYMPVYLFLVDGEESFWNAMERSRKMVWENFLAWFLLALLLVLLNILGCIPCFVGLFVTMPLSLLMLALAYEQQCLAAPGAVPPPLPEGAMAP